jgi:glycosyltransferase involved in cell wall biosynthesis
MKISILTAYFYTKVKEVHGEDKIVFGGAERYLIEFCKLLQSLGHDVKVYQALAGAKTNVEKFYEGIPIICIGNLNAGWKYTTNSELNMVFNEMATLDDLRIYFATYLAYPQAISPCISISHGVYWEQPYGEYKHLCGNDRREYMKKQLYGFTAPDVCISVDSNVKKVIASIEPGAESRIRIIYNFVDTGKFYPESKRDPGKLRVLFPRRLTTLRGINEFIKATKDDVDIYASKIGETKYDYLIVGQCHDENAGGSFSDFYKNSPHIKIMHRPMEQMPEIYREADISVVPTKCSEGLSLSLLESMATGLPVITTPVGGLGDAIINGYNGFAYEDNYEDLFRYIDALGSDQQMREVMGKRNIEIARGCFDIEIWKEKWMRILAEFGGQSPLFAGVDLSNKEDKTAISVVSDGEIVTRKVVKNKRQNLVGMMLTHNDDRRYLERVVENSLKFCDELVILDDHSIDGTRKILTDLKVDYPSRLFIYSAVSSWDNEPMLRAELLIDALQRNPDWVIAIDSDELYENGMSREVEILMNQDDFDWAGFRFYDMWDDEEHYRDDDIWPAGVGYAPRMFRVNCVKEYIWSDKKRHCGSIPENVIKLQGTHSPIRVKHLGYVKAKDRQEKFKEKKRDDPENKYYSQEVYLSIISKDNKLVKWDNDNIWQTGKLTIAYPPGMEWGNMKQRPHHLLKLMASERNRVFFGDDKAAGIGEIAPYLTIINDWGNCGYVKNVDVVYLTSFSQRQYLKNINYKHLIYDCVDWAGESDKQLIQDADYVLCASKLLYDRCVEIAKGKVLYIPNACDYEHFSRTGQAKENVVGYMGAVTSCIDGNIISEIGRDYKTLIIGPTKSEITNTNQNIEMVGHVPYSDLPLVLSAVKVGIIPFRLDDDYLRYCAPIKVYEYLAAGRPVVASPIPELTPLADAGLIQTVDTQSVRQWLNAIEISMVHPYNKKGQEWAKGQTWQHRWKAIKDGVDIFD